MIYKNAEDILPAELLSKLQEYLQGELVYIPKKEKKRAGWGEMNGTKSSMQSRNSEIFNLYTNGVTMNELTCRYHLSEDSIRKIITKINKTVISLKAQ